MTIVYRNKYMYSVRHVLGSVVVVCVHIKLDVYYTRL